MLIQMRDEASDRTIPLSKRTPVREGRNFNKGRGEFLLIGPAKKKKAYASAPFSNHKRTSPFSRGEPIGDEGRKTSSSQGMRRRIDIDNKTFAKRLSRGGGMRQYLPSGEKERMKRVLNTLRPPRKRSRSGPQIDGCPDLQRRGEQERLNRSPADASRPYPPSPYEEALDFEKEVVLSKKSRERTRGTGLLREAAMNC